MKLIEMTALELAAAIKEQQVTVRQAVEAVWAQMGKKEPLYRCFITVGQEEIMEKADRLQKQITAGEITGPLAGVPIAVKDNLCTRGVKTTCGSRILENFIPGYSAEAVSRLEEAGMIIIGKTNMDEFAMGSTTETSAFGITCNPWNRNHVPGGSSGGSAAAVAAGECFLALGTDTGGSIRQPAAHCGIVGLKPTYGTVSRYGLIAYASSMDQIGPMAGNVADCAALLDVIAGHDPKDATSMIKDVEHCEEYGYHNNPGAAASMIRDGGPCEGYGYRSNPEAAVSMVKKAGYCKEHGYFGEPEAATSIGRRGTGFSAALTADVEGMKIGIPRSYLKEGLQPEVKAAVQKAARILEQKGALLEEFELTLSEYAVPAYYTIAAAEASSNLERFDGIKYGYHTREYRNLTEFYEKTRSEGFGREVKRRIMLGSFALSAGYYDAYYLRAAKVRRLIKEEFDRAFTGYDIILAPTAPTTAPLLGKSLADPIQMYLADVYTISANLAGFPAISLPGGWDEAGLPIGIQLMAGCFEEKKLIRAAYTLESEIKKSGATRLPI